MRTRASGSLTGGPRPAHPATAATLAVVAACWLVVALDACGCSRKAPPRTDAQPGETGAVSTGPRRVHLFPAGSETLRVEIHYVADAASPWVANGATVSLSPGGALTLQGDLDSQEEWTCVDSLSGRDLNGDGALEAVLTRGNGGRCGTCLSLVVVSAPRGEPRVISPDAQEDLVPRGLADLRHRRRYQLLMLDTSWEAAHGLTASESPRLMRVWAWNGRAYAESTTAFPAFVRSRMRAALDEACSLEGSSESGRWLGRLAEYVLCADMLGQGRAALDTLRAGVAAHPPAEPRMRATATEVEVALQHRVARRP